MTVTLDDPTSPNGNGIGATVDVYTGARRHRRWMLAGSRAMFSGVEPEVHVGLGAGSVDRIAVTWPDGAVTEHAVGGVRDARIRVERLVSP